jgi:acyl carrier protein
VSDDATFDRFRTCAVEVLQVPAEKVELVMALEEAFDITVAETELEGIETIGQAYELVTSKL